MKAGKGRQQLNNALGNFRKGGLFSTQQKNISAGVYTGRSAASAASGWVAPKKRKRADGASGGILGVPTVVSASGAVVQKIARPPPPPAIRNLSAAMNAKPNAAIASGNRSAALVPPKRESRGQKMLYVSVWYLDQEAEASINKCSCVCFQSVSYSDKRRQRWKEAENRHDSLHEHRIQDLVTLVCNLHLIAIALRCIEWLAS